MFGRIVAGEVRLNAYGRIVEAEWVKTSARRDNLELDAFVVMPNHFHAIVVIAGDSAGTARRAPTFEDFARPISGSLPTVVRSFKSAVTKRINESSLDSTAPVWQRGYYEHAIRNEHDLALTREYVMNNPLKWDLDEENPGNLRITAAPKPNDIRRFAGR
jgi:putative transposase